MRSSSSSRRDDAGLRPWYASAIAMMKTNSAFVGSNPWSSSSSSSSSSSFLCACKLCAEDVYVTQNLWRFNTNTTREILRQKMTIVLFDEKKMTKFLLFTLLSFWILFTHIVVIRTLLLCVKKQSSLSLSWITTRTFSFWRFVCVRVKERRFSSRSIYKRAFIFI